MMKKLFLMIKGCLQIAAMSFCTLGKLSSQMSGTYFDKSDSAVDLRLVDAIESC